jgi:competence protein ComEA
VTDRRIPWRGETPGARDAHGAAALLLAAALAGGTALAGQAQSGPPFPPARLLVPQAVHGAGPAPAPPATRVRSVKPPLAGVLDLNVADVQALTALPGVGETLARRIAAYRASHGPFRSPDELLQVPGIGPQRLERIRPFVRVREGA